MSVHVVVFDPTASDSLSKVRGIGRYLQIMKENFSGSWEFTDNLSTVHDLSSATLINPFFNVLAPPLIMRRVAKKQIAVIHDLIPLKYPREFPTGLKAGINIFFNKLSLKFYDLIVTDSETSKKDLVNILRLPENRIKVIYPCLSRDFTAISQKTKTLKKNSGTSITLTSEFKQYNIPLSFCLYVGDATWNKNLINLAKAVQILNVTCLFAGKVFAGSVMNIKKQYHPWQWELFEFLKLTKNDKRFIFLGYIEDYKLIKLYEQARTNILISRDEGFGFSYLEAGIQRCPTVLSDIPVLHEISRDHALFANPHDPHAIAHAIGEIYFNKSVRTRLGKEAFERTGFFSPTLFRKQFGETVSS